MDLNYETTFKKHCLRCKTTLHKNYKLGFKKKCQNYKPRFKRKTCQVRASYFMTIENLGSLLVLSPCS